MGQCLYLEYKHYIANLVCFKTAIKKSKNITGIKMIVLLVNNINAFFFQNKGSALGGLSIIRTARMRLPVSLLYTELSFAIATTEFPDKIGSPH